MFIFNKNCIIIKLKQKKGVYMTNIEISRLLGIPYTTISSWKSKKHKGTWRENLYLFLASFTKEQVEERINNIKALRR